MGSEYIINTRVHPTGEYYNSELILTERSCRYGMYRQDNYNREDYDPDISTYYTDHLSADEVVDTAVKMIQATLYSGFKDPDAKVAEILVRIANLPY